MAELKLKMNAPVRSVNILNGSEVRNPDSQQEGPLQREQDAAKLNALCSALEQAIIEFHQLHEKLFLDHKEQIVRLSIEIANKILARDIQNRNYEIETIIAEAMKTIDISEQITIRLNPEDLKTFQETVESKKIQLPEKTMFVDDASVNNGECIIESNNGIIEHLIQEHLLSIENVLLEAQTQIEQV